MSDTPESQFLFYRTEDGQSRIDVRKIDETVWLSLKQMTELFQRDKSTISRRINNVFDEGELRREATVAYIATVQNKASIQEVLLGQPAVVVESATAVFH